MTELEELASNLRVQIARNPEHTALEKVELQDVEDWLKLRRREAEASLLSDDDITF